MAKRTQGKVRIECKTCGKIFWVKNSRKNEAKYCSRSCVYKSKEWQEKMTKQALKQLKKINAKWVKLKKDPVLENCLTYKENEVLFDNGAWIKESNYLERIKLTPKIIDVTEFESGEETISIKYKHFNPHYGGYKKYDRTIPRFFSFSDTNFCYFFGLWIGDRLRVGISNSDKELLKFTKNFLEYKFKQPNELILGEILYTKELRKNEIDDAERFLRSIGIKKIRKRIDRGGHLPNKINPTLSYNVLLSNNYILFHLLEYLKRKLWESVRIMDLKARFAFYAGLIDAEAHVNSVHRTVDIYQSDKNFNDNLTKQLREDGFVVRAAQTFVRIYINKQYEDNLILIRKLLPYLKHSSKINTLPNILNGNFVKNNYLLIVNWINLFPNKTTDEIASKFRQNKSYFTYHKLTQLVNQGFIRKYKTERKGKFRYKITKKGTAWLQLNKEFIKEKLKKVALNGQTDHRMYTIDMDAIKEMLRENLSPA